MSDQPPAGWYPAPDRPGQQRYFDGASWTEDYVQPAGAAAVSPTPGGGGKKVLIPVLACVDIAVLLAVVAAVVVAAGGGDDDEQAGTGSSTTRRQTTTEATTTTTDAPTTTEATTTRPTTTRSTPTTSRRPTTTRPTTTAPPTTAPGPGFGEGNFLVGTDVEPGLYTATSSGFCYWERVSGLSGEFDDIIANDIGPGQAIVEILASDVAFNTNSCGRWQPFEPTGEPVTTFGEGDWAVNSQVPPGRYRSEGGETCYWERKSSFAGSFDGIIANDSSAGQAVVEIAASDVGFSSTGCGTWAPAG